MRKIITTNFKLDFPTTNLANNSSGLDCCTYDCTQGIDCPIRAKTCEASNCNTNIIKINYPDNVPEEVKNQKSIFKNELAFNLAVLLFTYVTTMCIASLKFYEILNYTLIILGMAIFAIYSFRNPEK